MKQPGSWVPEWGAGVSGMGTYSSRENRNSLEHSLSSCRVKWLSWPWPGGLLQTAMCLGVHMVTPSVSDECWVAGVWHLFSLGWCISRSVFSFVFRDICFLSVNNIPKLITVEVMTLYGNKGSMIDRYSSQKCAKPLMSFHNTQGKLCEHPGIHCPGDF